MKLSVSVMLVVMAACAIGAGWLWIPSDRYPDAEVDSRNLRHALGEEVFLSCKVEDDRRSTKEAYGDGNASAIGSAEIATLILLDCNGEKVSAGIYTYRTRMAAWHRVRGLTQCGSNYCQSAWTRGRQAVVITGPRPEAGLKGPWINEDAAQVE